MNIKIEPKMWVIGLCFAGLLAASSAQASLTLDFNGAGSTSGDSSITGLVVDNVDDDATGEKVNNQSVVSTGVTTVDYLVPTTLLSPTHFQYGWVAYYNSTGTILEDLVHFDNSYGTNGTSYDSMFVYSGTTLSDISSSTLTSILDYLYLVKIDQNANGTFPLYTPISTNAPGLSEGGTAIVGSFQLTSVPEPSTVMAGASMLLPFGATMLQALRKRRTM